VAYLVYIFSPPLLNGGGGGDTGPRHLGKKMGTINRGKIYRKRKKEDKILIFME
jgi:hypothetical protein